MPCKFWSTVLLALACGAVQAATDAPVELHHRLDLSDPARSRDVALTLDACGGAHDAALIALLVQQQVPATLFVTKRWLDRNPRAVRDLLAHPELFELQNHGTAHVPAIIGTGRHLYGMAGQPDAAHVQQEVSGAQTAIAALTGHAPQYFRGAGAAYDSASIQVIQRMGDQIAGFSVNADAGASLPATSVAARLRGIQPGDIVIAHMNKPQGGTAKGFAQALPELQRRGLHFVRLSEARLLPAR